MTKKYPNVNTEVHLKLILGTLIRLESTRADLEIMDNAIKDPNTTANLKVRLIKQALNALSAIEENSEVVDALIDTVVNEIQNGELEKVDIDRFLADVQNSITQNMHKSFNKLRGALEKQQNND